jgi:hypothetical protein
MIEMPLFWAVRPVLMLKGVKSHAGAGSAMTENFYLFDKE